MTSHVLEKLFSEQSKSRAICELIEESHGEGYLTNGIFVAVSDADCAHQWWRVKPEDVVLAAI